MIYKEPQIEFVTLEEARDAQKGSFVGVVIKIGDLKSGTNSRGEWTMKIITIQDATATMKMACFNEEITTFTLGHKYKIENPWWKMKDSKLSLQLGQYAKVTRISDAPIQESIEDSTQTISDNINKHQAEIKKILDSLPPLPQLELDIINTESLHMWQVNQAINQNISQYEIDANKGMTWNMTEIIYNKFILNNFRKVSESK